MIICWQMPGGCRFAVCPCQKMASFNVRRTEKIHKGLQLEKAEVDKIKSIVSEHAHILDYDCKELESPDVFDGVMNFFDFEASDGRKVNLMAFNIGEVKTPGMSFSKGLLEKGEPDEIVVPVKAMEVVKTFEEIAATLVANGVDAKCLRLTYA